jgi:serine/threonine-protein kinase HipA
MASKKTQPRLKVWLDDPGFGALAQIGTLHRVGHDGVRFAYTAAWLNNPLAFKLDPALTLDANDFYPADSNFGVFMDSCPDRWGQVLMLRREAIEAKAANRPKLTLTAWEYLCGVQDHTRMGALRLSAEDDAVFLANELLAAPPMTSLAELQAVALELSRKKIDDVGKLRQWLNILVAPGASLGGARPKANLTDGDALWIAKFPSADDERDIALWEKLLHDMAADCGIEVPPSCVEQVGNPYDTYHTFMVRRFDRDGGARKFFTTAMTLLHRGDQEEASYIDLAQFIAEQGSPAHIAADLRQLFTRVAFNIAVANRDDHLRNHGFMRTVEGWRLSPAFDMNPSARKLDHVLGIDEGLHAPSLRTLLETDLYYGLERAAATAIVEAVLAVVATWRTRAGALHIAQADIDDMAHLFMTAID